ncbi:MAG: HEAT repeat domain-containing protein [Candidatus Sumerlaeota bacterium]|nr:HEAT repeat domain-containing protein [Candidatus Sumerlaeota bacterium]
MAKRLSLDQQIEALNALEEAPLSEETLARLRKAVEGAQALLAARAAGIIGRRGLSDLTDALIQAFHRFLQDPAKSDKGCVAKTAIAEALNRLQSRDAEVFLVGVRHTQMEPSWGGPQDTADQLRSHCAAALVRLGHPRMFHELASLLMDREAHPRRSAVEALSSLPRRESELLLRMKILAGDEKPDVIVESLSALMGIAPDDSLDFVARYLDSDNPLVAEGAAMALGESRGLEAFEILRQVWENSIDSEFKKRLLAPIAQIRREESFEFLVQVLEEEHKALAAEALDALALYSADGARRRRVGQAVDVRDDRELKARFERKFKS